MTYDGLDVARGRLARDTDARPSVVVRTTSSVLAIAGVLVVLALIAVGAAAAYGTGYTYGPPSRSAAVAPAEEPPPSDAKALKRYVARAIWRLWGECLMPPASPRATSGCT